MADNNCDGLATLNIWVSELGHPCGVSERDWYVTIWRCDGQVLQHCGKRYIVMTAKCGRLSVKLPPGRYVISGVWSFTQLPNGGYRANHFTNRAVVTVCCDECACVTLYNPTVHTCGQILAKAAQDLVAQPEFAWTQLEQDALNAALAPLFTAVPLTEEPMFDIDPDIDGALTELLDPAGGSGLLTGRIEPMDETEVLATT